MCFPYRIPGLRPAPPVRTLVLGLVFTGLAISAFTGLARAGSVEDTSVLKNLPGALNIAPLDHPPGGSVSPVYFPPDISGYPGEVRDPRDVAPMLAFHKAVGLARQWSQQDEPTPAEAYYDARYYALDLNLSPSTQTLTGTVTMRATVVNGPLTVLEMDLRNNMNVSAVTCGGHPVTFTHANNLFDVNLDRPYNAGETVTIVTTYSGNPSSGGYWGWSTAEGHPMIWSLSEPFGARYWWPCKDYPDDKADSVDVRVTVPTGLVTASEGTLRQSLDNGTTAFTWWHENHPISTYLVSVASHNYNVYSDWYKYSPTDSMEIRFHNYHSSIPGVMPVQAKVKNMIGAYAGLFHQYPFLDEKYGHAEFPFSGGMEHQTCTSIGYFGEAVVAHELGHMWWGDMITCQTFHDVWLNEGFATYCQALWDESAYGEAAYTQDMVITEYFGSGTIYVPDTSDPNRIFDSNLSYNKASWVLHMLRGMVGDAAFFHILQAYHAQYGYSVANTADFEGVCESISGMDLHAFFQEWIYGEYFPIYQYSWSSAPGGGGFDVNLSVNQIQNWQIFNMPVEVAITTTSGTQSFHVTDTQASQNFVLHVDSQPTAVSLDPNNWILRQVMAPLPTPIFDRNVLLVNGVDWTAYGSELTSAYLDKAFWGTYNIDFWDCFPAPSGGYPSTLPAPLGHGAVTGDMLSHYKTVIWVGNNYNGDLNCWMNTPIYSYLLDGGDVLLMTRMGDQYLSDPFRAYLGVTWINEGSITDCISTYTGLSNIGVIGTQNYVAGFNLTLPPESTLLYKAVAGHLPNWGLGVVRQPAGGGIYNPLGGRFVLLNGRPYRWAHADLATNVDYILDNLFLFSPTSAGTVAPHLTLSLGEAAPNPFSGVTTLRYSLPSAGAARLAVWDVSGRRVRVLFDGAAAAGEHSVVWDGRNAGGHPVASGVYYVRLDAGQRTLERKVLRMR